MCVNVSVRMSECVCGGMSGRVGMCECESVCLW